MNQELDNAENVEQDGTLESKEELDALLSNKTGELDHLSTETKPSNPDTKYLYQMIITVYFRERWTRQGERAMTGNAMHLDAMLRTSEVDYQSIHIPEKYNTTVHIHCSCPEEREHVKHILLREQAVLCFENDGKRYWGLYADDDDKDMHRWAVKQATKERKDLSIQQKKK